MTSDRDPIPPVIVTLNGDALSFSGGTDGDGNVTVQGEPGEFQIQLSESTVAGGASFVGIKMANITGNLAPLAEEALMQPSIVSNPNETSHYGPLDVSFLDSNTFSIFDTPSCQSEYIFFVGVKPETGPVIWSDPRIYNQGGGTQDPLPKCQQRIVVGGMQILSGVENIYVAQANQDHPVSFSFPFQSAQVNVVATITDPGFGLDIPTTAIGTRFFSETGFSILCKAELETDFNVSVSWIAMGPAIV